MLLANLFPAEAQTVKDSDLKGVFPEATSFEPVKNNEELIYYKAKDSTGNILGAVFMATGDGHSGNIVTLAGMLKDGTVTEIKVLFEDETPNLGSRISEAEFTDQFKNKKDLSGVQAITGATISSQALIDSVKKKSEEIKRYIK